MSAQNFRETVRSHHCRRSRLRVNSRTFNHRLYAEAETATQATHLAKKVMQQIQSY